MHRKIKHQTTTQTNLRHENTRQQRWYALRHALPRDYSRGCKALQHTATYCSSTATRPALQCCATVSCFGEGPGDRAAWLMTPEKVSFCCPELKPLGKSWNVCEHAYLLLTLYTLMSCNVIDMYQDTRLRITIDTVPCCNAQQHQIVKWFNTLLHTRPILTSPPRFRRVV